MMCIIGPKPGYFSLEAGCVLVVVNNFEKSSRQRVKGISGSVTEPDRYGELV